MNYKQKLWQICEPAVNYFFPNLCVHCRIRERQDNFLCRECYGTLSRSVEYWVPQDGVLSVHQLHPALRSLVHALKYQGMSGVADYLIQKEQWVFPGSRAQLEWIPVPIHGARWRERGYNQAELIARSCAKQWGGRVWTGILKRRRYANSQTKLDAETRRCNIAGSFTARPPCPQQVILVDDVYTTGSTTQACVRALEEAGARSVLVFTLAWEPPENGELDWALDQKIPGCG